MMRFWTFCMVECSNTTPFTNPSLGLPHVLILRPFSVPVNTVVFTVTFCTPCSWFSLPKLPMLHFAYCSIQLLLNYIHRVTLERIWIRILPDAMAWATSDLLDPEIGCAGPNRDAVVTGLDSGSCDCHVGRHLDMDPIGVGTVSGCRDLHGLNCHSLTAVNHNVVQLAVDWGQAADHYILRVEECQWLHQVKKELGHVTIDLND